MTSLINSSVRQDMESAPTLRRSASVSRQLSTMAGRGRLLKLPIILVSVSLGILCGHLLFRISGSRSDSRSRESGLRLRETPERDSDSSFHQPPAEREGISIKKDMSIQFRTHQSKNYFINVGGTYPKSLEIFLQTYPASELFSLVSFIPDETYAPFYDALDDHQLISPAWISASEEKEEQVPLQPFGEDEAMVNVPVVDLAAWLQNNTHPDDFVIVKMDIPEDEEEALMTKLVHTEAVEWIDKYYTTFPENQHHKLQTISEVYGLQIFGWDDVNETFSDFNDVNPVKVPPGAGFVKRDCRSSNSTDMFALFLYVKDLSVKSLRALKMLAAYNSDTDERLDIGVFLPYDLIVTYGDLAEDLFLKFQGGLYLEVEKYRNKTSNQLRNSVTRISNICAKFQTPMILQYILFSEQNEDIANSIISLRHQTVFYKLDDVASLISYPFEDSMAGFKPKSGTIYSLSVEENDNEKLAVYLLKHCEEQLISLIKCAIP